MKNKTKDNALTRACLCLFVKSIVFLVFFYVSFLSYSSVQKLCVFLLQYIKVVCAYI